MADLAFNFAQLDPNSLTDYLKRKKAQEVLQPDALSLPSRELPKEVMPELPDPTSPKSLVGDLTPQVPDLQPKIPTNYDIDQQLMADRSPIVQQRESPYAPTIKKIVERTQNVPKENEMDLHPSKMRRVMSVLGGVGAGFLGGVPGAMATYQQIRHPEYVSAMRNYLGQRDADTAAAKIAAEQERAEIGQEKNVIANRGLDLRAQTIPSQIAQKLAQRDYTVAKTGAVETPQQRQAREEATNKAKIDETARVKESPVWRFKNDKGQTLDAKRDPVSGKWYAFGREEDGPIKIPNEWKATGQIGKPSTSGGPKTDYQARYALLQAKYGSAEDIPVEELNKLDNEMANSKVTRVAEANSESQRVRAQAMALNANIRGEKELGGGQPTPYIQVPGGVPRVAPISAPPSIPAAPGVVAPRTAPVAPGAAPAPVLSPMQDRQKRIVSNARELEANPSLLDKNKDAFGAYTKASIDEFVRRTQLPRPRQINERAKFMEDQGELSLDQVRTIRGILSESPKLYDWMGAIVGRYEELVSAKTGADIIPGLPSNLKEQAQRLAVALKTLVGSEAAVANRGTPTDSIRKYIASTAPGFHQEKDRFNGALKGVEDFANSAKKIAMFDRFAGKWTPDADVPLAEGMMHTNRDLFKVGDKTYWKNIIDETTGQKYVATDKGYKKVK